MVDFRSVRYKKTHLYDEEMVIISDLEGIVEEGDGDLENTNQQNNLLSDSPEEQQSNHSKLTFSEI